MRYRLKQSLFEVNGIEKPEPGKKAFGESPPF